MTSTRVSHKKGTLTRSKNFIGPQIKAIILDVLRKISIKIPSAVLQTCCSGKSEHCYSARTLSPSRTYSHLYQDVQESLSLIGEITNICMIPFLLKDLPKVYDSRSHSNPVTP